MSTGQTSGCISRGCDFGRQRKRPADFWLGGCPCLCSEGFRKAERRNSLLLRRFSLPGEKRPRERMRTRKDGSARASPAMRRRQVRSWAAGPARVLRKPGGGGPGGAPPPGGEGTLLLPLPLLYSAQTREPPTAVSSEPLSPDHLEESGPGGRPTGHPTGGQDPASQHLGRHPPSCPCPSRIWVTAAEAVCPVPVPSAGQPSASQGRSVDGA